MCACLLVVLFTCYGWTGETSTVRLRSTTGMPVAIASNARVIASFEPDNEHDTDGIFVPADLIMQPYESESWETPRSLSVGDFESDGRIVSDHGSMIRGAGDVAQLEVSTSRFVVGGIDLVKVVKYVANGDILADATRKARVKYTNMPQLLQCTGANHELLYLKSNNSSNSSYYYDSPLTTATTVPLVVLDTSITKYVNISLGRVEIIRSPRFPCTLWTNANTLILNGKDITPLYSHMNLSNPVYFNRRELVRMASIHTNYPTNAKRVPDGDVLEIASSTLNVAAVALG